MSRDGSVALKFGDGEYTFRLAIARLKVVQEKCDCGPMELLRRFTSGDWRAQDVQEPLREGLIGGGMAAVEASQLIDRYCGDGRLTENVLIAFSVVSAAVAGAPDEDDMGEPEGEAEAATRSPEESSGSPAFTGRAPRSGGRRAKSTTSPSGS